mgnify:CR=1 FL=1
MPHTTSFEPLRSQRVQKKIENFDENDWNIFINNPKSYYTTECFKINYDKLLKKYPEEIMIKNKEVFKETLKDISKEISKLYIDGAITNHYPIDLYNDEYNYKNIKKTVDM